MKVRGFALLLVVCGLAACGNQQDPSPAVTAAAWPPVETSAKLAPYVPDGDFRHMFVGIPQSEWAEIELLIDQLVAEADDLVPANATVPQIALAYAWYVHTHIENHDPNPPDVLTMLQNRSAECGGSDVIFQMMIRRKGIATRSVGIYSIPLQSGHSTAEVYWDGTWHYVDPTFGAYATQDGAIDSPVLTWDELSQYRDFVAPNFNYAVSDGRLGWNYVASPPGDRLIDLFSQDQTIMQESGNYDLFLPAMNSAVILGPDADMETTYRVDLSEANAVTIGTADGSHADITTHTNGIPYDYDAAGMWFVGNSNQTLGLLRSHHVYTITGLKPGDRVRWEAGVLSGVASTLDVFARKGEVTNVTYSATQISVEVTAKRESVELHLVGGGSAMIEFDYHSFTKL